MTSETLSAISDPRNRGREPPSDALLPSPDAPLHRLPQGYHRRVPDDRPGSRAPAVRRPSWETMRGLLRDLRELVAFLWSIAIVFLLVFLGGALVGAFIAGCNTVASLAPVP